MRKPKLFPLFTLCLLFIVHPRRIRSWEDAKGASFVEDAGETFSALPAPNLEDDEGWTVVEDDADNNFEATPMQALPRTESAVVDEPNFVPPPPPPTTNTSTTFMRSSPPINNPIKFPTKPIQTTSFPTKLNSAELGEFAELLSRVNAMDVKQKCPAKEECVAPEDVADTAVQRTKVTSRLSQVMRRNKYRKIRLNQLRRMVLKSTQNLLSITGTTEENVLTLATMNIKKPINFGVIAGHGRNSPVPTFSSLPCKAAFPIQCFANGKWRTKTGVCNNIKNDVLWGSQSSQLLRYVPSAYADGRHTPRGGYESAQPHCSTGNKYTGHTCEPCVSNPKALLPNPKYVSHVLHQESPRLEDRYMTHMFILFGQFLDHDLDLSPEFEVEGGCCMGRNKELDPHRRDKCFDVHRPCQVPQFARVRQNRQGAKIPHGDGTNPECLAFARSSTFCNNTAGMREQFNGVTSFVDGSMVYGSTTTVFDRLRRFTRGMKWTSPENLNPYEGDDRQKALAGDERVRENVLLASIHAIFTREHNRMAQAFYKYVQGPSEKQRDEECYQRARRLLGAQIQNIVYGQYLTVLLGSHTMREKNLHYDPSHQYDPNVNPGIKNSFSTAAFRFGHSGIQSKIEMRTPYVQQPRVFNLRDHFFNLNLYYEDNGKGAEKLLNGMLYQPARSIDHFITREVTRFLFGNVRGIGQDLIARNIQRGRDHGLPGYNEYREFCGMPRACTWNTPPPEIEPVLWHKLQTVYDRPSDIDLFVAGVMETPFRGGVVGRTFNCIISQQFQDLKFGDRFFYAFRGPFQPYPFTEEQLRLIRARTLTDILCDNTDLPLIPENAFWLGTREVKCGFHNKLDVAPFMDQQ